MGSVDNAVTGQDPRGQKPTPDGALSNFRSSKMKTFVPQKPANAGAIATTIDFGAASAEVLRLFHPGVYTLRLESVRVPSRLKLSSIGARSASSSSGSGSHRITAAPLQNEPA